MAGCWTNDNICRCVIDTNDRFKFVDYSDWDGRPKESKEVLDRLQKGVDFCNCQRDARNKIFVKHDKERGIVYNDHIVFTKEELERFSWKTEEKDLDDDDDVEPGDDPVIRLGDVTIFTINELNTFLDSCIISEPQVKRQARTIICSVASSYSNNDLTDELSDEITGNDSEDPEDSEDSEDLDNVESLVVRDGMIYFGPKLLFTKSQVDNIKQRLNKVPDDTTSVQCSHLMQSRVFTYWEVLQYIRNITQNAPVILTNKEIRSIRRRVKRDIDDNKFVRREICYCPGCKYTYKKWERNYGKWHKLYAYITPPEELEDCEKSDPDGVYVVKEDGIEFKEGDEIIHVGRKGAHVHISIPII